MTGKSVIPMKTERTGATAEDICRKILSIIEPSEEEREKIQCLTCKLQGRIAEIVRDKGLDIEVSVEGSFAKGTWVREEVDVDIFLFFPTIVKREDFENLSLEIAEKALAPNETRRRYAEHPYLEAVIEDVRVNIVPAYRVQRGHWRSATDRTPFHTQYVKEKLGAEKRREVLLLKKFMKGIGVYGAEIRVGGFSGYLSEILILKHQSFMDTMRSVAEWNGKAIIDLERYYESDEVSRLFPEPLVVIDPVDRQRNVASAVTLEKLSEFIAACREFLRHPHEGFFLPEKEVLSQDRLLQALEKRGTYVFFIIVNGLSITPDVLWGQLYKSLKATCRFLTEEGGFDVLRSTVWSEEQGEAVFCIELESGIISRTKERIGPFVWSDESISFIEKYLRAPATAYGPWIRGDRWMVRVKRDSYSAADLVREELGDNLDNIGLGSKVRAALRAGYLLMVKEEILPFYLKNKSFARHLTGFLEGVPVWLRGSKAA